MLRIKVVDGTKTDRHLCASCEHGQVIEGQTEFMNLCQVASDATPINFRVYKCSKYEEKSMELPEYRRMLRQAIYLVQLASGNVVGLTVGQQEDYEFMKTLKAEDVKRHKIKKADEPGDVLDQMEKRQKKVSGAGK